jgi:hypothetical protein
MRPSRASALRAAATLAAVILSFLMMLGLCRIAGSQPSPAIVSALLAIGIGRRAMPAGAAHIALALVRIAAIAVAAAGAGWLLLHVPFVGAVVFVIAMSASVWLRNFGSLGRGIGAVIAIPFLALLVVPAAPDPSLPPLVNLALVVAAGVVAALAVALVDALAARLGLHVTRAPEAAAREPAAVRTGLTPHTRMALQLAVALGAAFVLGFLFFPQHWGWSVLTAFIVCAGARGRGDAAYKAVLRLAGAIAGTVAAAVAAHLWIPTGPPEAIAIFVVLFLGLWLRDVNYAYWAGATTLILAVLSGANGAGTIGLLGLRVLAIVVGALCAVVAAWFVLPIRSEAVVRRRLADALVALDTVLAASEPSERSACLERFHAALADLEQVAPPLRWHRRVLAREAVEHPARWIELAHGLREHAATERDARERGALRKAVGVSRRAIGNHGAAEPSPDIPPIGMALATLHDAIARQRA